MTKNFYVLLILFGLLFVVLSVQQFIKSVQTEAEQPVILDEKAELENRAKLPLFEEDDNNIVFGGKNSPQTPTTPNFNDFKAGDIAENGQKLPKTLFCEPDLYFYMLKNSVNPNKWKNYCRE